MKWNEMIKSERNSKKSWVSFLMLQKVRSEFVLLLVKSYSVLTVYL